MKQRVDSHIVTLVQNAKRYDVDAFEQIYDLFADHVYRYLVYHLGDQEAAEALVPEVFEQMVEAIELLNLHPETPARSFVSWMFQLASACLRNVEERQLTQSH